jgi:hypothetical protein
MAWNGSGTYSRTNGTNTGATTWADDAGDGTKILAARHDTHDEDIATAINACLTKNNETKPTADFVPNADALYDLGSSSAGWVNLYITGDLVLDERADHAETPAAGKGQIWVKNDAPSSLYYTDDSDVDVRVNATLGTETATTSGTSINFTGIPADVFRITIMLSGVSQNGAVDELGVQVGDSGGLETTGYTSNVCRIINAGNPSTNSATTKFQVTSTIDAATVVSGHITITRLGTGTDWICSSTLIDSDNTHIHTSAGIKSLSGVLDRISLISDGGTFDAGSMNIIYE